MNLPRTAVGAFLAGTLAAGFILPAAAANNESVTASVEIQARSIAPYEERSEKPAAVFTSSPVLLGLNAPKPCPSRLVGILREAGFRGENLREAWSIAMRESHGHPKSVSSTHDYGLFQFNKATFHDEKWWSTKRLLKVRYNARTAYRLSEGGRTWYLWGLDGHGEANPHLYRNSGWSEEKIEAYIVAPYRKYYAEWKELPARCK